jgi:hypothetical protein
METRANSDEEGIDPETVAITDDDRASSLNLPYDLGRYFEMGDAIAVPVTELRLSRARPGGISSAAVRMREAYDGIRARRAPITIQRSERGGYLVLDGNSTVTIALAAGWPCVACRVSAGE